MPKGINSMDTSIWAHCSPMTWAFLPSHCANLAMVMHWAQIHIQGPAQIFTLLTFPAPLGTSYLYTHVVSSSSCWASFPAPWIIQSTVTVFILCHFFLGFLLNAILSAFFFLHLWFFFSHNFYFLKLDLFYKRKLSPLMEIRLWIDKTHI